MDTPDGPPSALAVSGRRRLVRVRAPHRTGLDADRRGLHAVPPARSTSTSTRRGSPRATSCGPCAVPRTSRRRVEVHRAAFAPSKLTIAKYELLVRQPHYAFDRDVVVEAPDGSFAAFAMCWIDPVGRVGEFEPVGVHPDHQRRGLGRVVMRHGLRLMRAAGMLDAIVFSLRTNAASEALYRSAGFDELAIHRRYTKACPPRGRSPEPAAYNRPHDQRTPGRPGPSATRWARWRSRPTPSTAPRPSGPS